VSKLKVSDEVRLLSIPEGENNKGLPTLTVYKKLLARKRPVRIDDIDEYGTPWFSCRMKLRKNGRREHHMLALYYDDNNWIKVKKRKKNAKV